MGENQRALQLRVLRRDRSGSSAVSPSTSYQTSTRSTSPSVSIAQEATWEPEIKGAWIFRPRDGSATSQRGPPDRAVPKSSSRLRYGAPIVFRQRAKTLRPDDVPRADARSSKTSRQAGYDVVPLEVARQAKFSFPLAAMVTVLIGVPFSFTPGKTGRPLRASASPSPSASRTT